MVEGLTSSATDQGSVAGIREHRAHRAHEATLARSKLDRRRLHRGSAPATPNNVQTHEILVTLAERPHPFPSRTRKLSSPAPKILRGQPFGNIGRRQDFCVSGPVRAAAPVGPAPLAVSCRSDDSRRPRRVETDRESPGASRRPRRSRHDLPLPARRRRSAGAMPSRRASMSVRPRPRSSPSASRRSAGCASATMPRAAGTATPSRPYRTRRAARPAPAGRANGAGRRRSRPSRRCRCPHVGDRRTLGPGDPRARDGRSRRGRPHRPPRTVRRRRRRDARARRGRARRSPRRQPRRRRPSPTPVAEPDRHRRRRRRRPSRTAEAEPQPDAAGQPDLHASSRATRSSSIAARFGTTVKALQKLNGIKDPSLIRPGQVLKIP